MGTKGSIVKDIRAALEREPRVNPHRSPIEILRLENDSIHLRGEVASIETKRLAVECARAVNGVHHVTDGLRVHPTATPGDGAIRDSVSRHLLEEPVFLRSTIRCRIDGDTEIISRSVDGIEDVIEAAVANGVVTLRGHVQSLSHSRLAAVLAWWTPGCCDVVNELEIRPPESDNDDELSDAIKIVLAKDPLVHGDRIAVRVRDREVRLRGLVANEEERRMATQDVWYVEGVRNVIDELDLYPARAPGETMYGVPSGIG